MNEELMGAILVVDDEERIRRLLKMYLEREGYTVEEASNGSEALEKAFENEYVCIILDIMMPEKNGLEVCEIIKENNSVPIILLTAKGEETDRIKGLEIGADDYIVKPFSPREVTLRVKSILRRTVSNSSEITNLNSKNLVVFTHLVIDHDAHRVTADNSEVSLTPKEYDLLHFLAKSPDKVFGREELLKEVWHYDFFGDLRTVDTHVKRLREKLNTVSPDASKMISTVWGIGYKFQIES